MTRTPLFMRYDMSRVASPIGDASAESGKPHSKNSLLPEGAPSSVIASTSLPKYRNVEVVISATCAVSECTFNPNMVFMCSLGLEIVALHETNRIRRSSFPESARSSMMNLHVRTAYCGTYSPQPPHHQGNMTAICRWRNRLDRSISAHLPNMS